MTQNSLVTTRLQTLITNGDEVDRCYAIQGLVTIRDAGSTALFVKCLRDDDIDVCVDAATALGELGGESAVSTLIESLINDPDGEVKVACVKALASLGDSEAIPHLLKLAEHSPEDINFNTNDWDPWWDMQLESIKGLGKMQSSEAVPILQRVLESGECIDIENEILNALAAIGGSANKYLIQQLSEGIPRTRRRVAKALGRSQSESTLKPLARALTDPEKDTRDEALHSLLKRNAAQYLPAVLLLFRDTEPVVRQSAIKVAHQLSQQLEDSTIDALSGGQLLKTLIPLLQDPDPIVKTAVLNTLINLDWKPDRKNSELIITMLRDSIGDHFAAACRFIRVHQLENAIPVLLYMFRNDEMEVEEKVLALNTLGTFKLWNSVIESCIGACVFDQNKTVRLAALEALADLDKLFSDNSICKNDNNRDEIIRLPIHMITEALQGELEPPAARKTIPIIAEETPEQQTSSSAADHTDSNTVTNTDTHVDQDANTDEKEDSSFVDNALDEISQSIAKGEKPHPLTTLDSMAIASVEKQLEQLEKQQHSDEPEQVLSTEERDELKDFLDLTENNAKISKWLFTRESADINVDIQHLAARLLGRSGSANAIPALLSIFPNDDSQLKCEAILSIGLLLTDATNNNKELRQESVEAIHDILVQELGATNRDLRIAAARVLGNLGTSKDIPLLLSMLQDNEVAMRIQTIHSLSELAQRSTKGGSELKDLAEKILQQLDNNDTGVHRAAVDALVPLFRNKLNGDAVSLREAAISSLIDAGLSGSDGQVLEMSRGLNAMGKELSSTRLLTRLDELSTSIERRYIVEMLGELHRPGNHIN